MDKGTESLSEYLSGLIARLSRLHDSDVSVELDGAGYHIVRVNGTRVELEAHYHDDDGTGAWVTIDGVAGKFFGWEDDFIRLWHEPELFRNGLVALPPVAASVIPPAEIRHVAAVMRARSHQADVVTGFDGQRWTVDLHFEAGVMRMAFFKRKKNWALDTHHPFQIIVDGEDITTHAGGKMDNAIKLLLAGGNKAGQPGASSVAAAGAEASNSVTVRRASVIRV